MERLIDFHAPEVQAVLPLLLEDKSTGHNIIWATDPPEELRDSGVTDKSEITIPQLQQIGYDALLPRQLKQDDDQRRRTRKKGEVFTPAWLCNKMNNLLDADWFGRDSRFNLEADQGWQAVLEPVSFPEGKKTPVWQKYVDSRRLEITCGEAPFLVSRYDAATGQPLPLAERIGILDRKLRVVSENAADEAAWIRWAVRAVQATYGYEYQGDNLLLARTNLLLTVTEHLQARWHRPLTTKELHTIANIIAWNVWQMDGLHLSVPGGKPQPEVEQMDFFSMFGAAEEQPPAISCKVKDWRANKTQDFETIQERSTSMKFDYVIGNPPYQEMLENTSDKPVYNDFMEASYKISNKVELITPARFLFNAGKTPKEWNLKMLADEHFKVLFYEQDSSKIFSNTDIKGGVAITYRDAQKSYGAIGAFSQFQELNQILTRVRGSSDNSSIDDIIVQQNKWDLEALYHEHPEYRSIIGSKGTEKRLTTPIFSAAGVFTETKQNDDDFQIIGLIKNARYYRYVARKFIEQNHLNLFKYKVILPASNGSGAIGEVLSTPLIGEPLIGYTQSFIGIGCFSTRNEAEAACKYIKTKFARTMLGTLKITQHNHKGTWKNVPLQDFTSNSDIDWSKSVAEIDQQLYRKYDLSAKEIDFIETHVKEMA